MASRFKVEASIKDLDDNEFAYDNENDLKNDIINFFAEMNLDTETCVVIKIKEDDLINGN